MKNRTIFSSIVLAFLVSAFFMSVSTVFGANPTGQPPAGVVGPTFSGLDLQGILQNTAGDVVINDNIDARGYIKNTVGDKEVNIGGVLDVVNGQITSSLGQIQIDDDLVVNGTFKSSDIVSNPDAGYLELPNETHITGPLLLHKLVPSGDPRGGEISAVSGQEVTINGPIVISGNGASEKSEIKSDVASGLEINAYTTLTKLTDVTPAGAATFKIGSGTSWLGMDTNEIGVYGGSLYVQNDSDQGVIMGSSLHPSSLKIYGSMTATGGIGKFYVKTAGTKTTCSAGLTCTSSVACSSNEVAVNCGTIFDYYYNQSIKSLYVSDTLTTCTVNAKNLDSSTNYLRATAVCFDSGG